MQALGLLLDRHSCASLSAPAPEGEQLSNIWRAGLKAPDHGGLKPWRFIHVAGAGLDRLGEIFAEAATEVDLDPVRARGLPLRAPLITIVVASPKAHAKVPESEQILSAGCCVHAMQMAALAQGYNGFWRTGAMAYSQTVNQQLGLADHESIVGFLYLGTPQTKACKRSELELKDFVSHL